MKKLSNKGFTLVELIIVIAILAIIMLIAIPNFSGIQQRMQVRADKSSAAQIGKAVRIWYTEYTSDKAFETAVGATNPVADFDDDGALLPVDDDEGVADESVMGKLPKQGETSGTTAAPVILISKLNEYVDVNNIKPTSLRALDAEGNRTTLVEDNQYYSACLVGSGTAEKVVVCISDSTLPIIPAAGSVIEVGYTGDGVIETEALKKFNATVAYMEP